MQQFSKLSLIDLAGSERGVVSENKGLRLREGAKINQSLLALANCINVLGDKNKKGSFIPYRDSKLTRLLKDSLGGNCQTIMLVNISPSESYFEESTNSLKYGQRAKNIKTKPIENAKLIQFHILEYQKIINDLKREVNNLKRNLTQQTNFNKNSLCERCKQNLDLEQITKIKSFIENNFREQMEFRTEIFEIEFLNKENLMKIKENEDFLNLTISNQGEFFKVTKTV